MSARSACYHLRVMQRHEVDGLRAFFRCGFRLVVAIGLTVAATVPAAAGETLRVGSKRFTESYILGEVIAGTARRTGTVNVEHRPGLGNTAILFEALRSGAIDLYPDYSGTVALELLGLDHVPPVAELNRHLARHGLAAGVALGFGNSYALAIRENPAAHPNLSRISDLAGFAGARISLSAEFLHRRDGWPALRRAYGLEKMMPIALEHGLAYAALAGGRVDVIDVYTTDARLTLGGVRVLEDDRNFFPDYRALLVYRTDLPQRFPEIWTRLLELEGSISDAAMRRMNAAVELAGQPYAAVAAQWLDAPGKTGPAVRPSLWSVLFGEDLLRLALQHVLLVCASLLLGVAVGVPLGMLAQRVPRAGPPVLALSGLLQTVPSLALLAFLVAALDRIGALPAILALFLYSLLPIVRGTETALAGVGRNMRDAARALGLDDRQRMLLIELPLARPGILAGIKTAAVINVGTATVAAFIGAGGFGERIVAGLAVNDHNLLLAGAIPAAALALLVEWGFRCLDRLGPHAPGMDPEAR